MTSGYPQRGRLDAAVVRDLFAIIMILLGAAGLCWAAFSVDWRLGVATLSVALLTAGAFLGYDR